MTGAVRQLIIAPVPQGQSRTVTGDEPARRSSRSPALAHRVAKAPALAPSERPFEGVVELLQRCIGNQATSALLTGAASGSGPAGSGSAIRTTALPPAARSALERRYE